ncbi:hypothetical protein EON65_48125 [archaeon]|nr:MAG: hypothetical protein EON65_48125 [archaeon]
MFSSLHRIVEYVDIKVSKCFAVRQRLSFLYDVVTNSTPLHDERWPLFAYLMALYQENIVKGLEAEHHSQYTLAHVEGMEVALLADSLFWLGSCYYSINQFISAKSVFSGALRLYLVGSLLLRL